MQIITELDIDQPVWVLSLEIQTRCERCDNHRGNNGMYGA